MIKERIIQSEDKLKKIEDYLDRHPEIPIEVIINIKNIIHS